ncbi:hypothetical protein [Hyalangium versicolor]|uniref:hypothetical protein n=1 Tax=Hyalangium versicolor TaxID=2861190 RepID=UPI001CCFD376|nr:hypothetical protein [Hyalangium versicolor]
MTSGRFWVIATTLASTAVAVAIGCGEDGAPCTACPSIEGRYPLEFAAGSLPAECTSLGVTLPKGPLEIQHTGSQLNATLDAVGLQGTLFQNYSFTLLGSQSATDGGTTQFSLSGTYIPGRADGGTDGGTGQLSGSFTGTYTRPSAQGTARCSLVRAYTATQNGQP